jgi:hypothetical protein
MRSRLTCKLGFIASVHILKDSKFLKRRTALLMYLTRAWPAPRARVQMVSASPAGTTSRARHAPIRDPDEPFAALHIICMIGDVA